jgi:hypothetical protein
VGPKTAWTTWRRENSWPYRDSNSDASVIQPVVSSYTDCSVPARHVKGSSINKRLTIECSDVLCVGEGVKFSTSEHHSITCRTGKEYGREQGKLIT